MFDIDTLNEIHAENRKQIKEERELKNRILRMSDSSKKAKLWSQYFAVRTEPDDSYLLGNIF